MLSWRLPLPNKRLSYGKCFVRPMIDYGLGPSFIMLKAFRLRFKLGKSLVNSANIIETVHRQQLTFFPFRPSLLGLFTKIQTSIWSEFSGQKGMPCFASSLLDRNPRQRAPQILNGPIGQGDTYQPVTCLLHVYDCYAFNSKM